ncbi:MAG: hypothetical protein K0Q55_1552 [Verrucomicrobia bacterium]|jgi:hypothetical protein|nr:hypothetical protein [Verrucomicrobiota bacterium]
MILVISIAVSLLTAALFFKDFFDDRSDFTGCLSESSRKHDGVSHFPDDPEGVDDNGVSRFKLIAYVALVLGSGLLVYVIFTKYFGADI